MIYMSLAGDTRNVIIEKVFMANRMSPLAIQRDENYPDSYKILFKFNETISDNCIYFEARLLSEDELDKSYIESRSIYIDNLKKNPEKMAAFKAMMKEFSNDKFYMGDFNYEPDNMNYKINGYKQMNAKNNAVVYEHMSIYIPRYMFIILSLYMEDFLNPYNKIEKEFLFASDNMMTMRFEKAEHVKLVNSTKYKEEDEGCFYYPTMYEMNCGPTFWKFVYDIISEDDLDLKKSISYSDFNDRYSEYKGNLIGIVEDREDIYVVVFNDKERVSAIRVNQSLVEKTNLKDPYFIFDLPEELEEELNKEE